MRMWFSRSLVGHEGFMLHWCSHALNKWMEWIKKKSLFKLCPTFLQKKQEASLIMPSIDPNNRGHMNVIRFPVGGERGGVPSPARVEPPPPPQLSLKTAIITLAFTLATAGSWFLSTQCDCCTPRTSLPSAWTISFCFLPLRASLSAMLQSFWKERNATTSLTAAPKVSLRTKTIKILR